MLQKKLIWQIFPANLGTILVAIIAVTWYASSTLYTFYVNESGHDLTARAYLIKTRVEKLLSEPDAKELLNFCVRVGQESATRITVIDSIGTVLADSNESPENMENHQMRSEIARAFSGERGQSLRVDALRGYSPSCGQSEGIVS